MKASKIGEHGINVKAALNYIQEHGNTIDMHRLNYEHEQDNKVLLKHLKDMQNEDGGVPYNLEKGRHSSVSETCWGSLMNLT